MKPEKQALIMHFKIYVSKRDDKSMVQGRNNYKSRLKIY